MVRRGLTLGRPNRTAADKFASRYFAEPSRFVRECFHWKNDDGPSPYQEEVLDAIPRRRRVAVRGPHGLGKTALAAWAVLWFALTREAAGIDWKIPTTASAWRQLINFLWPEIRKWARRLNWEAIAFRGPLSERSELLGLNLKLSIGEAFALASDNSVLIEGAHAAQLLYLFDESKAIPPDTWNSAEGAFSTGECFFLAVSTPGEPVGRFYDIHKRRAGYEDWWARHVTLSECVAAGRVSQSWAGQRAAQWGEASAVYQNRVLGEFASSDTDGVIPLSWIELANERWYEQQEAAAALPLKALGVDVGTTGDKTVMAPRRGDRYIETLRYNPKQDTMQTAGRVKGVLDANPNCGAVVDVIGIGAGVVHRLQEQSLPVDAFNAAEGAKDAKGDPLKDKSGELAFANKRAAAWWYFRERLDPTEGEGIALPPDDILTGDLTAPTYKVQSGARILIESKEDIKKRLGRSTDAADAVIQAFWTEPTAIRRQINFA